MAKLENKAKENPKLEQNVLSDGRISLYLEYYPSREETPVLNENGNPVLYGNRKDGLVSPKYISSITNEKKTCSYT